jgi:hypothetical protein
MGRDKEVFYVPLLSLCEGCANDRRQCGLYRPRMVRDDMLPWSLCGGYKRPEPMEGWDVQEVEPAV